jgi:hypothetical protein
MFKIDNDGFMDIFFTMGRSRIPISLGADSLGYRIPDILISGWIQDSGSIQTTIINSEIFHRCTTYLVSSS